MNKVEPQHYDKLGNLLKVNDVVAVAHHNGLMIGRITKINNKMVKVKEFKEIPSRFDPGEYNKYSSEMVKIPDHDDVVYVLKHT